MTLPRLLALCGLFMLAACQNGSSESGIIGADAAISQRIVADSILVDKSERTLTLYSGGKAIARYNNIRFGDQPIGHKRFEGDERTPEGIYTIDRRNPNSIAHLSLGISYPNAADRAYAQAQGLSPGGDIFIHGQMNGWGDVTLPYDWTDGCIALSDAEMDQLWQLVPIGAVIEIRP